MSVEAVRWAMDDAPMLLTDKGKPDSTARHVLQALAEHAHKDGTNAYPSVRRLRYRTGYDRRTVQRALRRLEDAKLITADGMVNGCTRWRLSMDRCRPESDWSELEAEEERERAAAAERKRRSRTKAVTHSDDVTVTHSASVTPGDVTHSKSGRHASAVRDVTQSASGRHALSAARTISEPPVEPPPTSSVAEPVGLPQVQDSEEAEEQREEITPEAFLQALPAPWTLGGPLASAYGPKLAEAIAERHWRLDAALVAELTKNPDGIRHYASVLRTRIENLPYRQLPAAKPSRTCRDCGEPHPNVADNGLCPPCIRGDTSSQQRHGMPADFRQLVRQASERTSS